MVKSVVRRRAYPSSGTRAAFNVAKSLVRAAVRRGTGYVAKKGSQYVKQQMQKSMKSKPKVKSYTRGKFGRRRPPMAFPGRFSGKFGRPYNKVTKVERFSKNGFCTQSENSGTLSDPDVVGVGHSTYSELLWGRTLAGLLVRQVLYKGTGVNPASADEPFSSYSFGILKLKYTQSTSSSVLEINHTITSGSTINSCANTFVNICNAAVSSGSAITFKSFEFYQPNDSFFQFSLNLETMVLKVYSQSVLKIQNRTLSESASSSTDVVDNNPISGYAVGCSGGVPNVRATYSDNPAMSTIDERGVVLVQGAQLSIHDREPYRKINFTNGKYEKRLLLQPGQIKYSTITAYKQGYLNNLLRSIRVVDSVTAAGQLKAAPGKCEMFMFEEVINSGLETNMVLGYEQELKVCMDMFPGSKKAIRTEHYVFD
jgi:hypothetical protein